MQWQNVALELCFLFSQFLELFLCSQFSQVLTERMQEIEGVKKSSSDDIAALQKTVESQRLENTKLGQGLEVEPTVLCTWLVPVRI